MRGDHLIAAAGTEQASEIHFFPQMEDSGKVPILEKDTKTEAKSARIKTFIICILFGVSACSLLIWMQNLLGNQGSGDNDNAIIFGGAGAYLFILICGLAGLPFALERVGISKTMNQSYMDNFFFFVVAATTIFFLVTIGGTKSSTVSNPFACVTFFFVFQLTSIHMPMK